MDKKKLGIMGGTFDPIHNGHLITAEYIRKQLKMEKVLFIPAYVAPHKIGGEFALALDRYNMVELAIKDNPHFALSDIEIKRAGVSYTYDTIKTLYDKYKDKYDLNFLVGADSVTQLGTWHKIKEIMEICTFVAAKRPGFTLELDKVEELFGDLGKRSIVWVDTPTVDVSATDIRQRVKDNLPIDNLVPQAVAEYIRQKDLYRR